MSHSLTGVRVDSRLERELPYVAPISRVGPAASSILCVTSGARLRLPCMTHVARRIAPILIAAAALGLPSDRVQAAPRGTAHRAPTAFGVASGGGTKLTAGSAPVASPGALTLQQRKKLLSGLGVDDPPGSQYAHASPGHAAVPGKMALVFVGAAVTNASADFASFAGYATKSYTKLAALKAKDPQYAGLWLKSEKAGARYLVECAVSSDDKLGLGLISDGGATQLQFLPAGATQIAWLVVSPDAKWHSYRLQGSSGWSLHGCTATRVP